MHEEFVEATTGNMVGCIWSTPKWPRIFVRYYFNSALLQPYQASEHADKSTRPDSIKTKYMKQHYDDNCVFAIQYVRADIVDIH